MKNTITPRPRIENLEVEVCRVLQETPGAGFQESIQSVLLWFDSLHSPYKQSCEAEVANLGNMADRESKEGKRFDAEAEMMPASIVGLSLAHRVLFVACMLLALGVMTAETYSLSWYLRFQFDSQALALWLCAVPMAFALAEPIYLHCSSVVTEQIRKNIFWIQGPAALLATCVYFYYMVELSTTGSVASRFSGVADTGLQLQRLRQLSQGAASILISGLVISIAISLLHKKQSVRNPMIASARRKAKQHHRKSQRLLTQQRTLEGELDSLNDDRERCGLLAQGRLLAAETIKQVYQQQMRAVFKSPTIHNL